MSPACPARRAVILAAEAAGRAQTRGQPGLSQYRLTVAAGPPSARRPRGPSRRAVGPGRTPCSR
jgi:hypothetical protein